MVLSNKKYIYLKSGEEIEVEEKDYQERLNYYISNGLAEW